MSKYFERLKRIKNIEYILLSIIIILAFVVRLYKINNPIADWHSWRQADTVSVSRIYSREGIDLLFPKYYDISTTQTKLFNPEGYRFVEFPIFSAGNALLFNNIGLYSIEIWGRLISIMSAVFSLVFLFLLGRRFINTTGGLLAAFFYAFLPFNIYFTRVILPEPLSITLGLLALYLFAKYIDNQKTLLLFVSASVFALAILVKPFVVFYGLPMAYLAVEKYGFKNVLKNSKFWLALIIALVPFFTWRVWINQFPEGIPLWKWAFNEDGIRFKPSFWRWIFGERLSRLILGSLGLIPFAFGILKTRKNNYFNHFFILGMFLYVLIFATASVKHDYYQTLAIPAISLILAQGCLNMWETKEFNKYLTRGVLFFSLIVMFIVSAIQVREFYKVNRPEIVLAGKAVAKIAPEGSRVIAPYNGDTAFLYQTQRRGWPVVDRPIDELIEKGASYFVSVDLNHPQTIEFSDRFITVEENESYIILNLKQEI